MKKILLLSSVFVSSLFIYTTVNAQYPGNAYPQNEYQQQNGYQQNAYPDNAYQQNANTDIQPEWGPSGYDYAENYYLPDVEAYYNVPRHQFVYFDRGNWVFSSSLPGRCANYDLYSGYKVVVNEHQPWFHFNEQRARFAPFRFRHDQVVLRDFHNVGRGGFSRPAFDNRGRDFGYARRDFDHRQDWGHGGFDRHFDDHGGRNRGRW